MSRRKRLGTLLLEAGRLSREQLDRGLLAHKKAGVKLGQYLVREGIVDEAEVIDILCRQLRLARYRADFHRLDRALNALIPADLARDRGCAPLSKKSGLLLLAMTDPLDIDTLDTIERLTELEVEPVICSEQELDRLLHSLYGALPAQGGSGRTQSSPEPWNAASAEATRGAFLPDGEPDSPVLRWVQAILRQAVRQGASAIHLSPGRKGMALRLRIDGKLHGATAPPEAIRPRIVSRIQVLAGLDPSLSKGPQEGRFTAEVESREIHVRVSTLPTVAGENVVLHLEDTNFGPLSMDRVGLSASDQAQLADAARRPSGLILAAGPGASGRTTTLYSILKRIMQPDLNIITLEDPVRYRLDGIRQVQFHRRDGVSFADGLRAVLRQDPDVILVGEVCDPATARLAVRAALSGCRVLTTIHADGAVAAVTRLMDMGLEPFLVASVLRVSFAQRLVRTNCLQCREPYTPSRAVLEQFGLADGAQAEFRRGAGCDQCMNTGYQGRTGIFEVLPVDQAVQEMILERKSSRRIGRLAEETGRLRRLRDDAVDKITRGVTTLEEAAAAFLL